MSSGLSIEGLQLEMGGQCILKPLDLHLPQGDFGVLIGPSGSGKSSLLQCIAGLQTAHDGEIAIDGRVVQSLDPAQRQLAMVFQDHALFPHLTVLDNLSFGLRARGCSRQQAWQRARAVAERLGLEHCLKRRPQALSGGEQQRVALGRAMLREAKLVLMDEPLSSLDAPLRARMRQEILQLHQEQGWTTLYVTHDQVEAMTMADHLGLLEQGQLLQWGRPQELYQQPASLNAARFLGQPPLQLLPLHWQEQQLWLGNIRIPYPAELAIGAVAGIRPEHLQLASPTQTALEARSDMVQVGAQLSRVDHLGDRQWLHVQLGEQELTLSTPATESFQPGQSLDIKIPLAAVLWFDPQSGQRLC